MSVTERLAELQRQENETKRIEQANAEQALEEKFKRAQQEAAQQLQRWNNEKGPLMEAQERLIESGGINIVQELSGVIIGSQAVISSSIPNPIDFNPEHKTKIDAMLLWGLEDKHMYGSTGGSEDGIGWERRWTECMRLRISAPVGIASVVVSIENATTAPMYNGIYQDEPVSVLSHTSFTREEYGNRTEFERFITDKIWQFGARPIPTQK